MSDSGPLNEMKYWRKQVVQLHCIINQLRLPRYRAVIHLLNIAASPRSIVCIRIHEIKFLLVHFTLRNGEKSIRN
jgi:hypothetical protein